MSKQPVITCGEIWKVGWMCQHLPVPMLHQILYATMAMKCCTVLEQKGHHVQAVLVVHREQPASPYPSRVRSNIGHWLSWVKRESISAEEHDKHDFQSNLTAPCNFLPRWLFGHAIQHCVVSAGSQMSTTRQPLKWDRGMH